MEDRFIPAQPESSTRVVLRKGTLYGGGNRNAFDHSTYILAIPNQDICLEVSFPTV